MNTAFLSLTLAAFASLAVVGSAAERPQGRRHGNHPPSPLFQALDLDKDGVLSKEELAKATTSLAALDLNGDGVISLDELMPQPPPAQAGEDGPPPPPPDALLLALDANGDGVIDGAELAAAPDSLLSLDLNGDGQLTLDELRPAHPPHEARSE
jgi:Ca2+-binding EF-hand superfamily protein